MLKLDDRDTIIIRRHLKMCLCLLEETKKDFIINRYGCQTNQYAQLDAIEQIKNILYHYSVIKNECYEEIEECVLNINKHNIDIIKGLEKIIKIVNCLERKIK